MNSLIYSVIGSGIIVLGILTVRKMGMGKITRKLQYSLWLILPLYLIFSSFFHIKIPIAAEGIQREEKTDKVNQDIEISYIQDTDMPELNSYLEEAPVSFTDKNLGEENHKNGIIQWLNKGENFNIEQAGFKEIWKRLRLGITSLLLLLFVINNVVFAISLTGKRRLYKAISLSDIVDRKNSIRNSFNIYLVNYPSTPFLFGKNIYLHPDMVKDQEQIRYMVLHEICHFEQGDIFWNLLKYFCCAFYWFNPFVWIAIYYSGRDCELACDEAVIHMVGAENQNAYGLTLIQLISKKQKTYGLTIGTTMKGRKSMMKERIFLLSRTFVKSRKWTLCCLLCVFLLTGCALVRPYVFEQSANAEEYISAEAERPGNTIQEPITEMADFDSGIVVKNNCYNPVKRNDNVLFYGAAGYLQSINLQTNEIAQLLEGNIKPGCLDNDTLYYIKYPADAGDKAGVGRFNLTTGENEILIPWEEELWGCANMLIKDNCLYLETGHLCGAYLLENNKAIRADDLQNLVLKAMKQFDLTENEISGINYGFVNSILEHDVFTTLNRRSNELHIYDAAAQTVLKKENCLGNVIICDKGIVYMNLEGDIILNGWDNLESDRLLFSSAAAGYSVNYGTCSEAGLYVFRENGDSVDCKCITWEGEVMDIVNIPGTRLAIELNFSAFSDLAAYCKDGEIHIF